MINFSRVDTKPNLIAAITKLSDTNPIADEDKADIALAQQAAIAKIERLATNGAHVNLRVNTIAGWSQTEVQVAAQNIVAKVAAAVALLIACMFLTFSASAQIQPWPNSGTPVFTGNSNTPALDTNTPGLPVKQLQGFSLTVTNQVSSSYTGTVWKSFSPTSLVGAVAVGQYIYTGVGTNTFTTNFPAIQTNPPVYTIFQAGSGTNTSIWNFLYGP
jgi:hypothetical protein